MKNTTVKLCKKTAPVKKFSGIMVPVNTDEHAMFNAIFDAAVLAIAIVNDATDFIKVNKGFCTLFGYTKENLIGKPLSTLFPEITKSAVNDTTGTLPAAYNAVLKYTNSSGGFKDIEITSQVIDCKGELLSLIMAVDITGKKIAEEQVTKSKAWLIEAQQVAKVGSWETDLTTLNVTWSPETYRIFEIDPDHFQTSHPNFLDYVHAADRAMVDKAFVDSLQTTGLNIIEHRICTTSGAVKIVEERWRIFRNNGGKPLRAVGTCQDITERKTAEQMMTESEFKYRSVIEQATDAICITDTAFKIIDINPIGCQMLGYTKEEFLQLSLTDLFFAEDIAINPFRLDELHFGKGVCSERRFKRKNNTDIELEINVKKLEDGRYVAFARDITERKLVQQKLKESNERYNIISKATNDMVWDWNLETDEVYRNKEGWRKIFRTGDKEIENGLTDEWDMRIHPDDREKVTQVVAEIYRSEKDFFEVECRVQRDDGTYAYILDRGNIIRNNEGKAVRLLGATQDITERKESALQIAKSELRFRSLVQNGSDLISILDEKTNYIYSSPAAKRILGYEPEYMLGKAALSFIHPDDIAALMVYIEEIKTGNYIELQPFRFKHANGEWKWLESKITDMRDSPEVQGYVVNSRDVTERKMAEQEIQKLSIIVQNTTNAVIIADADGKIVWVNEAFTRITEFVLEEVQGKKPGDFLQGEATNLGVVRYMRSKLKKLEAFECDVVNYSKSGRKFWIRIQCQPQFDQLGTLQYFFALQTDISKEKEAEEILKLSEERYRYLFNNNPASILIWDINDFKILEVNDTAIKLYGYCRKEFLAKTIFDLRLPEDYDKIKLLAAAARQKPEFVSVNTWRHFDKEGKEMHMHIGSHRIAFKGRSAMLALANNITDKVLLEKMLEEERLIKQKEITAAVISAQEQERQELGSELHDNINQVLAGSLLYLGLVKKEFKEENAYLKETEQLVGSAITEIRKLSHSLIPPSLNESEFLEALRNIIQVTEQASGIMICLQTAGFCESSTTDKMKLNIYRIIQEQFNNILKHAAAEKILIRLAQEDNKIILSIKDDGKGFDTSQKATGVGLMNIKTRASLFNGELSIISSPGRGCELKVIFNPELN